MKEIFKVEKELSKDLSASASLAVTEGALALTAQVKYPISNLVDKATTALDAQLDKLKQAIPGTWDDSLIEDFKKNYKAELTKILTE